SGRRGPDPAGGSGRAATAAISTLWCVTARFLCLALALTSGVCSQMAVATQMFDDVANLIYDCLDWRRQHQHYLDSANFIRVPSVVSGQDAPPPAEVQKPPSSLTTDVDMNHYSSLMEHVPAEACSVPLILHCMLEQVCAQADILRIASLPLPLSTLEGGLSGLTQEDKEVYERASGTLNINTPSVSFHPVIWHFVLDVSWPQVERFLHQSVFESMQLTGLDEDGVLGKDCRPLGMVHHAKKPPVNPWDNPLSFAKQKLRNQRKKCVDKSANTGKSKTTTNSSTVAASDQSLSIKTEDKEEAGSVRTT
uniref:Uncharacterized protein n=1 Tax=Hippocampus comes TaxID=109280 RepID=A0A3Q2YH32_HIPCM